MDQSAVGSNELYFSLKTKNIDLLPECALFCKYTIKFWIMVYLVVANRGLDSKFEFIELLFEVTLHARKRTGTVLTTFVA